MRQYLSVFMINHYIVWLDISVHNPHTVAIIQSLLGKKKNKREMRTDIELDLMFLAS